MRFYTHIAAATLFFIIFSFILNIKNTTLFWGIILTSLISILPDIIDIIIDKDHRGIGHSLLLWIPIIGLLSIYNQNTVLIIALLSALTSHILLDLITRNGYPLFYPKKIMFVALNRKRRIKTGTKQDKAVFIFLIILLIPTLILSFNIYSISSPQFVQAQEPTNNTLNDTKIIKDNVNVNIDSKMKNTNISIKMITPNETEILITDIG